MDSERLKSEIASLSVLEALKHQGILRYLFDLLANMDCGYEDFLCAYSALLSHTLQKGSLGDALQREILADDNIFAQESTKRPFAEISETLRAAAAHDMACLNRILEQCSAEEILRSAAEKPGFDKDFVLSLPRFDAGPAFDLHDALGLHAFYRRNGFGFFAQNAVSIYKHHEIIGVRHPDPVRLTDLKGYEKQKNIILNNTDLFLSGHEANNILLYGDKGTGKSSTVKAIVNEFQDRGLRLIELQKEDLKDFHALCEILSESPFRFIVFLDDISFAKEDDSFAMLKAVIEGGVVKRPDNVLLYATSNRRHLIGENFSDRKGDDIHIRDTLETITSLSDRFGIEVVFSAPDKDEYLKIVEALAAEKGLGFDPEALEILAERFALLKSGRSPRTARQFILSMMAKKK